MLLGLVALITLAMSRAPDVDVQAFNHEVFLPAVNDWSGAVTPTPTVALPPTSTPASSYTVTDTPTFTLTPSPTVTPPPPVAGQNIAPQSGSFEWSTAPGDVICAGSLPAPNGPTSPCGAADGNDLTYWAPSVGSTDPQFVRLDLFSLGYNPYVDTISDVRLIVESSGAGSEETYQISLHSTAWSAPCTFSSSSQGYTDFEQLDCPFKTPVAQVDQVMVQLSHGGVEDGSYGLREVQVYKVTTSGFGSSPTATPSATFTVTPS